MKAKRQSDGRLRAKVAIGDGKFKYLSARSQKELDAKIAEVKIKLGKGLDVLSEKETFGKWSERWLKLKSAEISGKRYTSYVAAVKKFDDFKNIEISRIKTVDIQEIIFDLAAEGYAKQTLTMYRSTCSQIFKLAIENRAIEFNPAEYVKIPKSAPCETKRALTAEEQSWITDTPHRAQTAAMIMMYAGLRRGELIPLMWKDIDLNARTISVDKSVEMVNGKPAVKYSTKTAAGMRTVRIPQKLVDYLGAVPRNSLLVCPNTKGGMLSETSWKRLWESYIGELNRKYGDFSCYLDIKKSTSKYAPQKLPIVIPQFTAHWLRHTYITMLYMAGVDVMTAKEQAGHADIKTTMEIYTHLDETHKLKQIDKLDEYLEGCRKVAGEK